MSIGSYTKIYAIGHRATHTLFDGPVVIQEKVDGSQFSFMRDAGGQLHMRSKGAIIHDSQSAPDLFKAACAHVESVQDMLEVNRVYRGEVLKSPKHNVLRYDRHPANHIALFDVDGNGLQSYWAPAQVREEAERIGLESVPTFYEGVVEGQERLDELKGQTSFLGGQQIEGYVVKNYAQFTKDGKTLMGKWVSERFKEVDRKEYKAYGVDVIERVRQAFATEARWRKAVQHLAEQGKIDESPKDIGLLISEVKRDVMSECKHEIMEMVFKDFEKHVRRVLVQGLPEWYKAELEKSVWENERDER